jgi:iron complex outermembrane recepter protein
LNVFIFSMKTIVMTLRLSALACACATACAVSGTAYAQTAPELKEVVITGRLLNPADNQPYGINVITQDDIRRSGASNISDAIKTLLGVAARQDLSGPGESSLDLRGFGSSADLNQVIVVDGLRYKEDDLSSTRLASIPLESVEKIEVLRGNGAVLYGEGATGGVIVITTKAGAGVQRQTGGSVYVAGGSQGLREWRGNAVYAHKGLSIDASAQEREADNHRDNFASQDRAYNVSAQWSGQALRFGLRAGSDDLSTRLPGSLSLQEFQDSPNKSNTPDDYASIDSQNWGAFAQAFLGDWELSADFGRRDKQYRGFTFGFNYDYDVDAKNAALRASHSAKWGSVDNRFVVGFDDNRWQRLSFGNTAQSRAKALYARDELGISATGTNLSLGIRSEKVQKTDGFSPTDSRQQAWELGVKQALTTQLSAYGRIGTSFRLANADEIGFAVPASGLAAQKSKDLELGLRFTREKLKIDGRWYRSALTNEIGYDPLVVNPASFSGFGANVNFDPTRRQGLELDATVPVGDALTLGANWAQRDAVFRSGPYQGKRIALVPKHTLALRADWAVTAQHQLGASVNTVSSAKADFANECSIPGYTTANARYSYKTDGGELAVGVNNLTNHKFYTQAFGCAAGVTGGIYPEAGRSVTASLRLNF